MLASRTWLPAAEAPPTGGVRGWLDRAVQLLAGQSLAQGLALITGLLLVRWMDTQAYAEYTLAASALAVLNVATDLGLSSAVVGLGGRCHADSRQLVSLMDAALGYRRRLLYGAAPVLVAALAWIFGRHGWPAGTAWLISALVLLSSWLQAGGVIYGAVLKVQFAIAPMQIIDATAGVIRLASVLLLGSGRIGAVTAVAVNVLGSAWQFAGNRSRAAVYLAAGAHVAGSAKTAIWKFTRPLVAANLFYATQGQITIWLVSLLAPAVAIAEVGALGRLAQIALLGNITVTSLVQPYLARLRDERCRTRVLQITLMEAAAAMLLVISGLAFPRAWLLILGVHYNGLEREVMLVIALTGIVFLGDCCYFSLIARCQTAHQWLRIPVTVTGIAVGAMVSPPSATLPAVTFQYFVVAPYTLLQALLLLRYLHTL